MRQAADRQLVEGPERLLRVLPLPEGLSCGQHRQGEAGKPLVDELARLQPTHGFMRLVKDRVLGAWREMRSDEQRRIAEIEYRQKTIRERLDRLDEAFLYEQSIDIDTYDRQHDRLREELTLAQMERHARELEEWTWRASWRSQSAFSRARRTSGSSHRSIKSSGCSSCSFRMGFASTEKP